MSSARESSESHCRIFPAGFTSYHSPKCDSLPRDRCTDSLLDHSSLHLSRPGQKTAASSSNPVSSPVALSPHSLNISRFSSSPSSPFSQFTRLLLLCIAFSLQNNAAALHITQYSIPQTVDATNTSAVTLDCNYQFDPADLKLVVRWFHNDSPEVIYQWIPEPDIRYIGELIRPYFDMNFKVSDSRFSKYRALRLTGNLSVSLSGNYTCVISSIASQESRQGQMVVFVPPQQFEFHFIELSRDQIALECLVRGVYPRPVITFSEQHSSNNSYYHRFPPVNVSISYQPESDLYSASFLHPISSILSAGTIYECRLQLPGTVYVRKKRIKIIFPTNYAARPGYVDKSFSMSFSGAHRTSGAHWAAVLLALLTAAIITKSTSSLHLLTAPAFANY